MNVSVAFTLNNIYMKPIPIIDLFAGPGGLGEGFMSLKNDFGKSIFDTRLSIEKPSLFTSFFNI